MKSLTIGKSTFFAVFFLLVTPHWLQAQNNEKWEIFQLDDLNFVKNNVFLDTSTISGFVETTSENYMFKASEFDRVLFVMEGKGSVTIEKQKLNLKTSDVLFVKANVALVFFGKLKILSWVSKSTKTEHDFKTQVFSEDSFTSNKVSSENVWNRFINIPTMAVGLYMLPKSLNGDHTLNHSVDEINLVLNGSAKFKMDDTVIDVKPGSIMWVKRGVGHFFYDLSADFDVYILFENN